MMAHDAPADKLEILERCNLKYRWFVSTAFFSIIILGRAGSPRRELTEKVLQASVYCIATVLKDIQIQLILGGKGRV